MTLHLDKEQPSDMLNSFGITFASDWDFLLKGGHVLDALSACQSIAFDKKGTLKVGSLCAKQSSIPGHLDVSHGVNDPSCCTPNCESEALDVAAAMEKGTTHPIGSPRIGMMRKMVDALPQPFPT